MAVTKIWTIKDSLQRVLDYAANPDKTEYDALAQTLHYAENDAKTKLNESAQLVTGIHCRTDRAWEDMRAVQERFGKTDGVVALHAYQSFREGEVTPEQCHEIGVALARKVWGKRFQVLVATHMNTDNLHNHFVINSVSYVDGKKYEQRRSQYAEFRAASDKLCREYGLSVVEQPKAKEPARYARMREAIDQACEDASTAEDFHRALYRQGYIFGSNPNRRYATIRARDGGRAVRLYRLGEEYDLPAIDDRLRGNYLLYGSRLYERKHPPRQYTPKRYRPKNHYTGKGILQIFFEVFFGESQMHRLYLYYCYQLGILPKKQQPRINRPELERIHAFVHDREQMLADTRKDFTIPKGQVSELSPDMAFSDYMRYWLKMMRTAVTETTYSSYCFNVEKHIIPYFEPLGVTLAGLQPRQIQSFYLHEAETLKNTSILRFHANLHKALKYAVRIDLIASNPVDKVDRPKPQAFMASYYSAEEMEKLFEAAQGHKLELIIQLAAFYGLRRAEVMGLRWEAIDFEAKTLTIRHIVTSTRIDGKKILVEADRAKTKSSLRTLPLVDPIAERLKAVKEQQEYNQKICGNCYNQEYLGYVFVDAMGNLIQPDSVTTGFPQLLKENGLRRIRFHDLRHSCASLLLKEGVPMKQIQEWLGHSDISTTANIYAHLDSQSKNLSARTMANTLTLPKAPSVKEW